MPSGLYPRKSPRPTSSRAEQALHRALTTGLPAGWTAWHSLRVRTARGYLGEGDFVIAVPGRGVLVIEVKGGAIEQRDGHWYQNGHRLARMPLDQAHEYRTTLLNALRDRDLRELPFLAAAVAFVDTPFSAGPTQSDLRGAVLGQQDLTYIGEALSEMAERLLSGKRVPEDSRWLDVLHELWGETWTPHLALGDRIRQREAELVPLDAEQLAVLDAVEDNDRMLVRGGPGTGKTLLARDACRRFAARGHRPALLCSTSALATALRAGGLDSAFTVRALAADLLELAGVTLADGAPRTAWSADTWEQAPAIAADTLAALGPARERVDAVVVDEGQDLSDSDWLFVRALAHERPLWAFVDEAQGFWADRHCPTELFAASYRLMARYRCPEALARFADHYREGATHEEAAVGDELRVVAVADEDGIEAAVAAEIARARGDGAAPEHIAVLSLGGQTRTALCAGERIGGVPVVRADAPGAADALIADTFLRFKGLERPWIIVTELARGTKRYDVRMHVALTRATVGAVVVATREAIAADERLARVLRAG